MARSRTRTEIERAAGEALAAIERGATYAAALEIAVSLPRRVLDAAADLQYVEWQGRGTGVVARELCHAMGKLD